MDWTFYNFPKMLGDVSEQGTAEQMRCSCSRWPPWLSSYEHQINNVIQKPQEEDSYSFQLKALWKTLKGYRSAAFIMC